VVIALAAAAAVHAYVPVLERGDTVPAIPLTDQLGRRFSFADLRGDAVIVSFIYTACGDVRECPLVAAKLGRIQRSIGDAPIRIVALTLDPEHDSPAALRTFGAGFGADAARWRFAGGEPAAVNELVARFGITTLWQRSARTLAHDEAAIVIDREGRIAERVAGNRWSAADVLALARVSAGGSVDPATSLRLWLASAAERCGGAGAFSAAAALALFGGVFTAIAIVFVRIFRRSASAQRR